MTIDTFVRETIKQMREAMQNDKYEEFGWLADRFDYYDQVFLEEIDDGLRGDEDLNELHSLLISHQNIEPGLLVDLYYEAKEAKKKYARYIERLLVWDLFTGQPTC